MTFELHVCLGNDATEYGCLFGQDSWIFAKFFFTCLQTKTELRPINAKQKTKKKE